jgi:two-component system, cell cycle sensor histidine kinase and response regulator CckA
MPSSANPDRGAFAAAMADCSRDAILVVQPDGNIQEANRAATALYGYERHELLRLTVSDLRAPDARLDVERALLDADHSGGLSETVHRRKDGTAFPVEISAHRVSCGDRSAIVAVVRDITERRRGDAALLASSRLHQQVIDGAHEGIVVYGRDLRYRVWNPFMEALTGVRADDLLGKYPLEVFPFLDGAGVIERLERVLAGETPEPVAFPFSVNGRSGWTLDTSGPLRDADGQIIGVIGLVQDITERKRTDEEMGLLKRSIDGAAHAAFWLDADGRIVYVNDAACRQLGYRREELLDLTIGDVNVDVTLEGWAGLREEIKRAGSSIRTAVHRRKDGSTLPVEVSSSWIPYEGRDYFNGFAVNITERQRAETALRDSERRARGILNAIPDLVFRLDRGGTFLDFKADVADLYLQAATFIGRRHQEVLPPGLADSIDQHTTAALATGHLQTFEYRLHVPTRGERSYEARMVPCGSNEVTAFVRDVTDVRRADHERELLQAQLLQALKLESVGRLAGGVAHDFNNMLAVVIGHADLVLRQLDPASPLYSDLEEIRTAARRSADLTQQLLAVARRQTVAPRILDLNRSVDDIVGMLRRLVGESVEVAWQPAAHPTFVKIDPSQVDQILTNLCVNARDAIADIGRIRIETRSDTLDEAKCVGHPGRIPGRFHVLVVSDSGHGIEQGLLQHIFEPFFTTKDTGKGTGLGLATVYGIVTQNRGFIEVASEVGQGTTFTIYFPQHLEPAAAAASGPSKTSAGGHETILLVEDEVSLLKFTRRVLLSLGYSVLSAASPEEALRLAGEHEAEIDVLVTDVVMPGMNGRDLGDRLLVAHPDLKRVFVSGYPEEIVAHQGMVDAHLHFLQKPFSPEQLAAKVREALEA